MANGTSGIVDISAMEIALKKLNEGYDKLLKKQGDITKVGAKQWQTYAQTITQFGTKVKQATEEMGKGKKPPVIDQINSGLDTAAKYIQNVKDRLSDMGNQKGKDANIAKGLIKGIEDAQKKLETFRATLQSPVNITSSTTTTTSVHDTSTTSGSNVVAQAQAQAQQVTQIKSNAADKDKQTQTKNEEQTATQKKQIQSDYLTWYIQHLADKNRREDQYRQQVESKERAHVESRKRMYERLFADQTKHDNAMTMPTVSQTVFGNNQQVASVSTMNASVQQMRQAQEQLNMKTAEGRKRYQELEKEIKRTEAAIAASTGKLGEFIKGTQRSTKTMSELKGMIGMAFSVQTIWNFIKNVAKVTGQMELQHKALQAIVQDKYKADEIWSETMQNALKSPFSISQILEHTKKLAAYRIESDKLVETTRMLGDISAGVGVDMNRLVLAYGQVRAATYLRASELRQFTEADIPLLDELANYFTKLEGKVVSTGDVFTRISKRMVAFKDVETVIKQMTDEGGVFYNMQEIQSETLAGKIAKLKDSFTLMLDEIGTNKHNFLVDAIDATQRLMNNWERFAPIIQGILVGIMAKGIASIIVNIGTLISRLIAAQTAAAALGQTLFTISRMSTGGWLAIVGAVVALGTAIYNATTATDALTAKLGRIDSEVETDLEDAKEMFKELADEIRSSTTSYKDREDALSKLQRKYKEILPDYMLELEYLKNMKEGYEDANVAMELFYANEARKKKEKLINEEYDKLIYEETEDVSTSITAKGNVRGVNYTGTIRDEYEFSDGEANVKLIEKTIAQLEKGEIKADDFGNALYGAFKKYYKISEDVHIFNKDLADVISKVTQKYKKLENVKVGFYDTPEQKANNKAIQEYTKNFDELQERYKEAKSYVDAYYDALKNKPEAKVVTSDMTDEEKKAIEESNNAALAAYEERVKQAKESVTKILSTPILGHVFSDEEISTLFESAQNGAVELDKTMNKMGLNLYDAFHKGVDGEQEVVDYMDKIINKEKKLLIPQQWQDNVTEIQKSIFDTYGLTMQQLDGANAYAFTNLQEFTNQLQTMYNELSNTKIEMKISEESFKQLGLANEAVGLLKQQLFGAQTLEEVDKKMKAVEKLLNALGQKVKEPKTPKNTNKKDDIINRYKDAESLIKKLDEKYKELAQTMEPEKALETIKKIYNDTAKDVFKDFKWGLGDLKFDSDAKGVKSLTDNLNKLYDATSRSGKKTKELDNFLRDLKVTISDVEQKDLAEQTEKSLEKTKESIEKKFKGYDLFSSLVEKGVSQEFAKQFFGIDAFSLNDIKKTLKKELDAGAFKGEQGFEIYQELMEKVREKEQEEREQDLQHYIETGKEALTEAAKIKMQLAVDEKKILNAFRVEEGVEETEYQKQRREQLKQQALEGAQKKATDSLRKIEWEEFMNTDTFQKLMGDLENTSIAGLKHMKEKLLEYKEAWKDTPELLDDVIKKLQDVEDAMTDAQIKANPFKAYREAKDISKLRKGRSDADIEIENAILSEANRNYNNEISDLQSFLTTATDPGQVANTKRLIKEKENLIKKNEEQIKQNNAIIKSSKDQMKALDGQKEVYGKIQSSVADFGGALSELWEVFGDGDDVTGKSIDFGFDMADQVTQIITMVITTKQLKLALDNAGQGAEAFGAKLNMALGIIGWITMAISLVAKVWSFANEIHDDKLNKEIEDYKKNIEALEKSYEALEKAIESAYDSASLNENFDEANRNLEQRIAYEEAILEAEQSKKKKDQDAIDDAKESIEELREEQKQLLKDTAEDLGAIYDVRDATKDFVDAWMEAFKETGNGLKGLKDNFKETFKDIMLQQAVMTGAGKIMEPLFNEINKALEKDFIVDDTEYQKINKTADDQLGALDSFLTGFYEKYPDVFEAASELSGLQAGIEGITEQQAEVISAYLNSIRFFVHSIDENTKRLAEQGLTSTDMAKKLARANNEAALSGSQQDENPMLSQLQMLVEQTKAINDLLGSVTRHGHTKGGYGLKVFID